MALVQVPRVHAPPAHANTAEGRAAWTHYIVAGLERNGLSRRAAILVATHLAIETGWGQASWNNNLGNIKFYGNDGPFYVLRDNLQFTDRYVSYPSIEAGLGGYLTLLKKPLYAAAWSKLLAGDIAWYTALGLAGYFEGPPDPARPGVHTRHTLATIAPVQREYEGGVRTVERYMAAPRPANSPYPDISVGGGGLLLVALAGAAAWWVYKTYAAPRRNPTLGAGGRARRPKPQQRRSPRANPRGVEYREMSGDFDDYAEPGNTTAQTVKRIHAAATERLEHYRGVARSLVVKMRARTLTEKRAGMFDAGAVIDDEQIRRVGRFVRDTARDTLAAAFALHVAQGNLFTKGSTTRTPFHSPVKKALPELGFAQMQAAYEERAHVLERWAVSASKAALLPDASAARRLNGSRPDAQELRYAEGNLDISFDKAIERIDTPNDHDARSSVDGVMAGLKHLVLAYRLDEDLARSLFGYTWVPLRNLVAGAKRSLKASTKKVSRYADKPRAPRDNPKDVPGDLYELSEPAPYPYPFEDPTLSQAEKERRYAKIRERDERVSATAFQRSTAARKQYMATGLQTARELESRLRQENMRGLGDPVSTSEALKRAGLFLSRAIRDVFAMRLAFVTAKEMLWGNVSHRVKKPRKAVAYATGAELFLEAQAKHEELARVTEVAIRAEFAWRLRPEAVANMALNGWGFDAKGAQTSVTDALGSLDKLREMEPNDSPDRAILLANTLVYDVFGILDGWGARETAKKLSESVGKGPAVQKSLKAYVKKLAERAKKGEKRVSAAQSKRYQAEIEAGEESRRQTLAEHLEAQRQRALLEA
jgi:hypothetical protein